VNRRRTALTFSRVSLAVSLLLLAVAYVARGNGGRMVVRVTAGGALVAGVGSLISRWLAER
jgi:hypothetical protein